MPRVQQLQVSVSGSTSVSGSAEGTTTKVTGVRVGRPVRRVDSTPAGNINNITGIDVSSGKENGAALVYNGSSGNFEPTKNLENTNLNGGQY